MEASWIAAFAIAFVLFLVLLFARAWERPVLERRTRLAGFLLVASLAWIEAADILLNPDHGDLLSAIILIIAGLAVVGLGLLMARKSTRSLRTSEHTRR
jgi:hypothetical protein